MKRRWRFKGRNGCFYVWESTSHILADPVVVTCGVKWFWGAHRDGVDDGQ